jgi:hypothetical protein
LDTITRVLPQDIRFLASSMWFFFRDCGFLKGRVITSVFSRHYLTPQNDLKDKLLDAVTKLQKNIES